MKSFISLIAGSAILSTAVAAPQGPPPAPVADIIYPSYTSTYHANNGAVDYDVSRAVVSRSPTNGGADTSALLTFQVPQLYANRQCQLVFDLFDPSSTASGSQKAQIFTSLAPATASAPSWPNGNLRDQFVGTINAVAGQRATWEAGSGPGATNNGYFPCSDVAGKLWGAEVVPQGDSDNISWPAGTDGLKIVVLQPISK